MWTCALTRKNKNYLLLFWSWKKSRHKVPQGTVHAVTQTISFLLKGTRVHWGKVWFCVLCRKEQGVDGRFLWARKQRHFQRSMDCVKSQPKKCHHQLNLRQSWALQVQCWTWYHTYIWARRNRPS